MSLKFTSPIKPRMVVVIFTPSSSFSSVLLSLLSLFPTMNPLNQHSQSSGYMGLLQRQQSGALHQNSPYESFHSEASDFPQFSSQQGEAPTPPSDTPVERGKRHRWSPADDELLISAWLNTSKDTIVSNNQKAGTFWERVGDYFLAALLSRDGRQSSEHLHYKQRWCHVPDPR